MVAAVVAEDARDALRDRQQKVFTVAVAAADLVEQSLPGALALACRHDLKLGLPASTFDRPPARGARWRVMIDGIDGIDDPGARSRVLWSLRSRLAEPPGPHQLVVTTRPLPEDEMPGLRAPGVDVYALQPFDEDELDTFARRWFAARRPETPDEANDLAVRFVTRVAGARLGPVARVPLPTTIAAMVFEHDDDRPLPSSRAALYLVLAVTQAGLPRQISLDLLTVVAVDPRRSAWHRFQAVGHLIRSGDPQGGQLLRGFTGDRAFPRYLRWLILDDQGWPEEWGESGASAQR